MGLCDCDKDFSYEAKDALEEDDVDEVEYCKKCIMTKNETVFFNKLKKLCPNNYFLQCQIPLSSIVEKHSDSKFANELYRTIDFGFINIKTMQVDLLIEHNDSSHSKSNRIYRDIKVKDICKKAGITLLTFWTNYPNEVEYIKSKIEKYLK